jgi:hypothetical protein
MIFEGHENCKLAHQRALEISRMLSELSKLTDENEPAQNIQLVLLTSPLLNTYENLKCDIESKVVVKVKPRQIGSVLQELFSFLLGKSPLLSSVNLSARSNILKIVGHPLKKQQFNEMLTFTSLDQIANSLTTRTNSIVGVIDAILIENEIQFSAKADSGKMFINLKFPQICEQI